MEAAARTVEDFREVQKQWNRLDENRERRERRYEVCRPNEMMLHWDKVNEDDENGIIRNDFDVIIPRPLERLWWRQIISGDFIDTIYDNADEVWQLVEDREISALLKALKPKQKDVLFLSAVRSCTPQQIACYRDKTDRAVRKLLTKTLADLRKKLAPIIREQLENDSPDMTYAKRCFLERYENSILDNAEGEMYNSNILSEIKGYVSNLLNTTFGGTQ